MAVSMTEIGRMMYVTAKGYLNIPTVINMKATGRMIFNMVKVLISSTRAIVMKVLISWANVLAQVFTIMLMVINM